MKIFELFKSRVTRDIPPVVYFHEQSPEKLASEVSEYIITGGWPEGHAHWGKKGIHEHYVRLLKNIRREYDKAGGPDLPAAWISGFYGSGKSSFAKLLGFSLDKRELPDGSQLADAWLARDTSEAAPDLHEAWNDLLAKVDPIAVVFDIGGVSRGDEHIHSAVVRQVQARLDYCEKEPVVADYELKLERDGLFEKFEAKVLEVFGQPWSEIQSSHLVEDKFSTILHHLFPETYADPVDWISARAGQTINPLSAEQAAKAIADMLDKRAPKKTLFIVVDEASQYIFQDHNRMLALQSLVSALGQRLRGRAWLLATGQQQLDDQNDGHILGKMKDRFPPSLRVHLDTVNIRDVVHKRLLQKKPACEGALRDLYERHSSNLKLYAYGCTELTQDEFVDIYPMLPEHIELIMKITSALRTRSRRSQGDDHAIRGLLQLLGELFRSHGLADAELGKLVTIDKIFDVQGSALDADVQQTLARIWRFCEKGKHDLAARCAKAVALLELLQGDEENRGIATDSKLVASCLYADMRDGDNEPAVREALELLRRENLLGYSERRGYKIQSSAGQDWEAERRNISVPQEERAEFVREALQNLVGDAGRPQLLGRGFPWLGMFSTEHTHDQQPFQSSSREEAPIIVDFRFVPTAAQDSATWVTRSSESNFNRRLIWVVGPHHGVDELTLSLGRSRRMLRRFKDNRDSLSSDKRRLLIEEESREEELHAELGKAVAEAFMAGRIYFDGADSDPNDLASSFTGALVTAGNKRLPEIYPHFSPSQVTAGELAQLTVTPLSGPNRKFFEGELGILSEDAGRIVASCSGPIPKRVLEVIERQQGIAGATLLKQFGAPPYGYPAGVVKACVAGLLHAGKIRLVPSGGEPITSVGDVGVQDLFKGDRAFKTTDVFPAEEQKIKVQDRAKIRALFLKQFNREVESENEPIADAIGQLLPPLNNTLADVERRLNKLPKRPEAPQALQNLRKVFEDCLRPRQIEPKVLALCKHLDALREGAAMLRNFDEALTDDVITEVNRANQVMSNHLRQIEAIGALTAELEQARDRVAEQLRSDQPWKDVESISADVDRIREAYIAQRSHRLAEQERQVEEERQEIKALPDMTTLGDEERQAVLRPLSAAKTETTEEALYPSLAELSDGFVRRLAEAKQQAKDKLDSLISKTSGELVIRVSLELQNREIRSAADVDALLDEIRRRLLEQLDKADKVRLRLS
jgi:hypothetical protein